MNWTKSLYLSSLAFLAIAVLACQRSPDVHAATAELQTYLDRQFMSGSFKHVFRISGVEKLNGWNSVRDGTPSYIMQAKLHVTQLSALIPLPPGSWVSEINNSPGEPRDVGPVELEWRKTENGWLFLGFSENELRKIELTFANARTDQRLTATTMARICKLARTWELWATDHHDDYKLSHAQSDGNVEPSMLLSALSQYEKNVDAGDAWGTPFRFSLSEAGKFYKIISAGSDQQFGFEAERGSSKWGVDIAYTNGIFASYPTSADQSCLYCNCAAPN